MCATISMLPYSSSKAARLSGVAARTASKTSEERASPIRRSVWVRNISVKTSWSEKARTPPSRSFKTTISFPASRSSLFIQLRTRRTLPAGLYHPIKACPTLERLYPAVRDVFVVLLAQVLILHSGHIAHSLRERCRTPTGGLAACFEAGELIQNKCHDGALAPELFVVFCLSNARDGLLACFQPRQAALYAPHLLPPSFLCSSPSSKISNLSTSSSCSFAFSSTETARR